MTAPETPAPWSLPRRIAFRFVCAYLLVYCFPLPDGLGDLPWNPVQKGWLALVPWVGARVLHLATPVSPQITGSGDRTYDFVRLLCVAVLAVIATLVWSAKDRRRAGYDALHGWLRVYVRYVIATIIISYGLSKVFVLQFPFPGTGRLLEPYGDSSPMGLLWTFMGASPAYVRFAGAAEVLGGVLLLFRRTTTLGALVVAAVMSNVVMMNFCYDVPVKLGSANLLLLSVFLIAPDLRRLARFFLLNLPIEPAPPAPTFPRRWQERARRALKIAFVGYLIYDDGTDLLSAMKTHGPSAAHGPLEGVYEVEAFVRAGEAVPPLLTDGSRWHRVLIAPNGFGKLEEMDRTSRWFHYADEPEAASLTLTSQGGAVPPPPEALPLGVLRYTRPTPDVLALSGTFDGAPLEVRMKKIDAAKMPLVTRGFHWIQEYPYNR